MRNFGTEKSARLAPKFICETGNIFFFPSQMNKKLTCFHIELKREIHRSVTVDQSL